MYDALSLANDPDGKPDRSLKQVALKPTLRFVRQDDNLKQVMELTAQFSPGIAEAGATIRAGDRSTRWTLHPDIFGFVRQEVHVDEVTQAVDAAVTVEMDGQTASARCKLSPERRWKVFIQGSVHADIGFTDLQENVKAVHNQITARALETCQAYPEFKWNTEIAWVVDNFIHQMPPARAPGNGLCRRLVGGVLPNGRRVWLPGRPPVHQPHDGSGENFVTAPTCPPMQREPPGANRGTRSSPRSPSFPGNEGLCASSKKPPALRLFN